jgi:ankyrin repeat protein
MADCLECWTDSRRKHIVATLIRHGADVHIPDREGRTPLHHARARGFAKIQALLEAAGRGPSPATSVRERINALRRRVC